MTENAELVAYSSEEWKDFYSSLDVVDRMHLSEALCKLAKKEDDDDYIYDYYSNYVSPTHEEYLESLENQEETENEWN